ncbi:sensor domain-containing diguanylate cyclase [Clostridium transplantifaecale]|uniref:sensor domain-containing diguanylate cyclase n=1 Tax=Clostridium transplantifaecale TaxID=2479838 RepID=UPI000F63B7AA|nr:sensor domain-containing diguanylate cyclase [Clostridium transplantifaecale]
MKKKELKSSNKWQFSFVPIMKYSLFFCLITLLIFMLGGAALAADRMEKNAAASLDSSHAQISQRIKGTINLLESMASLPEFYDPEVPEIDKVKKLDQMSPYLGYMMICYVDSDIIVYSDGSEPASLASRDYMQQLFSTGQNQVTDSFAAGADGVTLNYTVAVPLRDQQERITGCLFCAIYFDEMEQILNNTANVNGAGITLIGTRGQIMSSTRSLSYGDLIMDELQSAVLIGTTANKLQEQLLAKERGSFWSFQKNDLCYTVYCHVDATGWDILASAGFRSEFARLLPGLLLLSGLTLLLSILAMLMIRRYLESQMKVVDQLVHSVEELEKKIYHDERPDNIDFNEIIRMTSSGLSDGLTGVVTRSVFLNQAPAFLKNVNPKRINVMCFVDMDNLKNINDTYGHAGGDTALKSIGYVLREYEKKYDGCVGRYGGDEFVLFLSGFDDEADLCSVLDELILRLHIEITLDGRRVPIRCSIGVALYKPGMSLEQLIHDADEALYFVKQNGKGYYKIYQN